MVRERAQESAFNRHTLTGGGAQQHNPEERRQHKRFEIWDYDIVIRPVSFFSKLFGSNIGAKVHDVSRGGAKVETTKIVKPGDRLDVKLVLKKFNTVIQTFANVRWSKQVGEDSCICGVMFDPGEDVFGRIAAMEGYFTSREATVLRKRNQSETRLVK